MIEDHAETPKKNGRLKWLDDERTSDLQTDWSNSKIQIKKDVSHINKLEQELGVAKGKLRFFNVKQKLNAVSLGKKELVMRTNAFNLENQA